jgi:hypothetical protein
MPDDAIKIAGGYLLQDGSGFRLGPLVAIDDGLL